MGVATWVMHAIRGGGDRGFRPRPGQVVRPLDLDRWRDYPADGLTPSQLASILRGADEGVMEPAMALFAQMEERDAHLYCVAHARRLAVTGLPWRIASAAEVEGGVERSAAGEAAAYAAEVLASIDRFEEVLQHLSLAVGRNLAVAENVWEVRGGDLVLADVVPVPFERLAFGERGELRVLTAEEPARGMALEPYKFIVHSPQAASGHPMRGGLLRVSALAYLGKHFSMKDWMVFAEVFGMPVRVARYEPTATPEEKRELLRMLQTLGTDAAAIFSKAVELELLEAGQGKAPPPYQDMCDFFNREMSKAWLGETLTVETASRQQTGAIATVHNEVRKEIRQDDLVKEARTIRRDVLGPMVRLRFGPAAPVPYFRRQFTDARDRRDLAALLSVAVNELGMRVSQGWSHAALGVPSAGGQEEVLSGKESRRAGGQ